MYLDEEYTVSISLENGILRRYINPDFWQEIIFREELCLDARKVECELRERELESSHERDVVKILGKLKFPYILLDNILTFCHCNSHDEYGPCSWERTWIIEYLDADQTKRGRLEEFQGKFGVTYELDCEGLSFVYSD